MHPFENAKWIWLAAGEGPDQYVEFCDSFPYGGGEAHLRLSVDSDYTLFVNGTFVASGQYGDFEHYKSFDTIDLTPHLHAGENTLLILAYHCGVDTSRYRKAKAGLIYELSADGTVVLFSREGTLSRLSPCYESGKQLFVSCQLGFTFSFDATAKTDAPYLPSALADKDCSFVSRPVPKGVLFPRVPMASVKSDSDCHYLIDLGGEVVGLPTLSLLSACEQTVTVAWGEHIADGGVRREIEGRHFFYTYRARAGQNDFTDYMLRLGCRYIEVFSEKPVTLRYAGVLPQKIPVTEAPCEIKGESERRIYDACVNTLRLCMMEHYVDCPWREQALYAFDSRNQMLCGYDAFSGGNAAYARANLALIGEDTRRDGLLSICYPSGTPLAIPAFSLYYIMAMKEYLVHTGDTSLAKKYFAKMRGILDEFVRGRRDGLVYTFAGEDMWNFYDWSPHLDGSPEKPAEAHADLIVNSLCVIALDCFAEICAALGERNPYGAEGDAIRRAARAHFLTEDGVFSLYGGEKVYTVLANALAVLAHLPVGASAEAALCERLISGEMSDCSLSMKILVYQALLDTDTPRYREWVLSEIRESYTKMLSTGSDTVWETLLGEADFFGAGSLCHGWSAVPVHIYHRLGVAVKK